MCTIGASAILLFSVQLLFVKMILPLFGGTPAVWNTAVLFFQSVLFLGYLYVDFMRRYLPVRNQVLLHVGLMLAACMLLPVHIVETVRQPDMSATPILTVLSILMRSIGLPFFVLSATSPLLQSWLASGTHADGKDPYFLYAASNAGSMLGLLAYPFAFEPFLGLQAQSYVWSGGYLLLIGLLCLSATCAWRETSTWSGKCRSFAAEKLPVSLPITNQQRLRWVVFAGVPSSLMLGVTTYLSNAIAPIPMLWMLPLCTYLMTLIIAFSRESFIAQAFARYFPLFAAFVLIVCMAVLRTPLLVLWFIWLHISIVFVLSLMCHMRLAQEKPEPEHLTEFYLWISAGGALGGLFNVLIAPVLFSTVLEYPLALCAAIALERMTPIRALWKRKLASGLFLGALAVELGIIVFRHPLVLDHNVFVQRTLYVSAVAACLGGMRDPRRFALALAVFFGISTIVGNPLLLTKRNFFGVKEVSVRNVPGSPWVIHVLLHNGTMHGIQSLDPLLVHTPIGYYGPVGDIIAALPKGHIPPAIGVVGLGAGTVACFARPGERWTFYEIDPAILQIARDVRYFSYLSSCAPQADVLIGDARLSLLHDARPRYDLMVLDAYSADQVPVHLLTREALYIYGKNLTKHGILAFHISNQHFDLTEVLGNLAADARLSAFLLMNPSPTEKKMSHLIFPSIWVVMGRSQDTALFRKDGRWHRLPPSPTLPLWTDDYSSLLRVLKWR
jgi:hypothetical protein